MQPTTPDECRANALKCFRIAQQVTDAEMRQSLLQLMVQWRELADRVDRLERRKSPQPKLQPKP